MVIAGVIVSVVANETAEAGIVEVWKLLAAGEREEREELVL